MSKHPWSSDVEAQAAIRAAEADRGPTLAHHEVPGAVERLAERVARLEEMSRAGQVACDAAPDGAKCTERDSGLRTEPDAASPGDGWKWLEIGEEFQAGDEIVNAKGEGHLRTSGSMVREKVGIARKYRRRVEQPAADSPQPVAATAGDSAGAVGLRTERVTLEVTHRSERPAAEWEWESLRGESVRVVPTPGPGLPDDVRAWIAVAAAECWGNFHDRQREGDEDGAEIVRKTVHKLRGFLARDAAGKANQPETSDDTGHDHPVGDPAGRRGEAVAGETDQRRTVVSESIGTASESDASATATTAVETVTVAEFMRHATRLMKERDAAIRERDAAREELERMTQAVGLLTTLHPTMEIDSKNPLGMAHQIHRFVTERLSTREAAVARVRELEAAGEPVAWGVMQGGDVTAAYLIHFEAAAGRVAAQNNGTVVPLYAAPPQERVVRLPEIMEVTTSTLREITRCLEAAGVRWEVGE